MSDELDTLKGSGIGAAITAAVGVLWGVFRRQAEKNADKVEADKEARLIHCEKALDAHRELIATLTTKSAELDTRLKFREGHYGSEPLTSPGYKPSPKTAADLAKLKEEG